jgi:hypothetical protein
MCAESGQYCKPITCSKFPPFVFSEHICVRLPMLILHLCVPSDFLRYASDKAYFSSQKHVVYYPTCFLWVPGIDPVSECTSPTRFTGCVLSSTYTTVSTYLSTGVFSNSSGALYFPLNAVQFSTSSSSLLNVGMTSFRVTMILLNVFGGNTTNVPSGCILGYYNGSGHVVFSSIGNGTLVKNGSFYGLAVDIEALGLPYEGTSAMFDTMHDMSGVLVGARVSLLGLGSGQTIAGYLTNGSSSVVVNEAQLAPLLTTCVPLTFRKTITSASVGADVESSIVYRRLPVDCVSLSSNAATMQNSNVAALFLPGGVCSTSTGAQLGYLNGNYLNSVSSATNVRFFSNWYGIMSQFSSLNDGFLFYNEDAPVSSFLGVQTGYSATGFGTSTVGGTPTCRSTTNVGTCSVSIDLTAFVPCHNILNTVWPTCQKPPAQSIYPAYAENNPTGDGGTFPYPVGLYKMGSPAEDTNAVTALLDAPISYWRTDIEYNEFAFMVHYCDFYYGTTTYPNGRPVFCANDPLSYSDRVSFCADFLPQYMFTGLVLTTLSFEDLCPFLNENIPNRAAYPYCLVFSDHSKYDPVFVKFNPIFLMSFF